ncbi:hypothetical protein [uncultured Shimia sp.]|uniref:hypothetical protein n=1 Tax=uncultured Shimia sp. TaxID=573152 RepID=UPI00263A1663|nr:hypothetical protein [uncultured Shimia sp.]
MFLFYAACIASVLFVSVDNRPLDLLQAIVILMRFTQIVICANFFYNCTKVLSISPRDVFVPALISVLLPVWGGLVLYFFMPDLAIIFNRYAGYLGNPNTLSLFIVATAPAVYAFGQLNIISKRNFFVVLFVYFTTSAYSLVLSGSNSGILLFLFVTVLSFSGFRRGPIVFLLGATLLYLFLDVFSIALLQLSYEMQDSSFKGLNRTAKLIVALIEGLDISQLGSHTYRDDVQSFLFEQQLSDFRRVFLGMGPGQSKNLVFIRDGFTVTVHNFYLLLFLEYGVLGAILFVSMLFVFFQRFFWKYKSMLLFSGFFIASAGTPVLYLPFFWTPLFSVLAGITILSTRYQKDNSEPNRREAA